MQTPFDAELPNLTW